MKYENSRQVRKIALLVACASMLQIVESLIPHPIPGVRLGLANMITLVALINIGFKASVEIAVMRTIVSSLILGTFLSPGFMLSFTGALASALVMGAAYRITCMIKRVFLSMVGLSLLGSITHNLVQIGLVYVFFIQHKGILMLLPLIGISSVIMGWISGLVASHVCRKLDELPEQATDGLKALRNGPQLRTTHYIHRDSPVHRLSSLVKMIAVCVLAVSVLIINDLLLYGLTGCVLASIVYVSRLSFRDVFSGIRKLYWIILFSFCLPLFLTSEGIRLVTIGFIHITEEGAYMGAVYASRIILLMMSASILVRTTSSKELAYGFQKILFPLKVFGISSKRVALIMTMSMESLPYFWEKIHTSIRDLSSEEKKLKKLIPALGSIIAGLFRQMDTGDVAHELSDR